MAAPQRALVTGATGAIGPCVVEALQRAGYRVRVLAQYSPESSRFPPDVEVHVGDITDLSAVRSAMEGVDAAVHMAALLHDNNPPAAMQKRYEQVNVGGTMAVIKAAVQRDIKRIVFTSTIAVYGDSAGSVLDEGSPLRPATCYAKTKRDAERVVLSAARKDGQRLGTVLRLGAVYGPRVKGNYRRLVDLLARHRFVPLGNGDNRRTLVYDREVARAILLALGHPAAVGRVYNVSDGEFHTMTRIIHAICSALRRRPPRFRLPLGPVYGATGVLENIARLMSYPLPGPRAMLTKYTEDMAVSSKRIQTELGFMPVFDLMTGWGETIAEMRRAGDL